MKAKFFKEQNQFSLFIFYLFTYLFIFILLFICAYKAWVCLDSTQHTMKSLIMHASLFAPLAISICLPKHLLTRFSQICGQCHVDLCIGKLIPNLSWKTPRSYASAYVWVSCGHSWSGYIAGGHMVLKGTLDRESVYGVLYANALGFHTYVLLFLLVCLL
jgi:hypothetical protein